MYVTYMFIISVVVMVVVLLLRALRARLVTIKQRHQPKCPFQPQP